LGEFFPRNFFTNTSLLGLSPLFDLTKCPIWGGYGGGRGSISEGDPHAINGGGTILSVITY